MKTPVSLLATMLLVALSPAVAAEGHDHSGAQSPVATAPAAPDAAWLAKAKAAYPLKTCVVSDEELGGMGDPVDYVHKQAGQPDRLVRFCCKMCVPKFEKSPAKYLAKIDAAKK